MRYFSQITGLQLKQLGLVTLIVGGLCAQALAQSPTSSPPPILALEPLPGLPALGGSPPPALPAVNLPTTPASPTLAALPTIPQAPAANSPSPTLEKLPELSVVKTPAAPQAAEPAVAEPAPPTPEATETVAAEKASGTGTAASTDVGGQLPPQGLPELPLPGAIGSGEGAIAGAAFPAISLPEIQVDQQFEAPKPKVKTWATKLAPSIIPPKTNFNYKRAVLPEVIYSTAYDRENQHLPLRVTRDDYENLLFASVTRNDIEATRALLNAGTGLQVTNEAGETPLAAAKRAGAMDVAALLVARGAR